MGDGKRRRAKAGTPPHTGERRQRRHHRWRQRQWEKLGRKLVDRGRRRQTHTSQVIAGRWRQALPKR